jgi:hypothetical protein
MTDKKNLFDPTDAEINGAVSRAFRATAPPGSPPPAHVTAAYDVETSGPATTRGGFAAPKPLGNAPEEGRKKSAVVLPPAGK